MEALQPQLALAADMARAVSQLTEQVRFLGITSTS